MVEAMEIQEGFKQTEVGVIPSDWLLISYDEAFDFLTTATYSRAQLSENDEIGYVHYGDIHTKCLHFLDFDKIKLPFIRDELRKNYPLLKDGDVIVVDASEDYEGVGKSVEVRNLKNRKVISGLHTFLLRDKKETIVNVFKGYIHSNKLVKKQMDTLATGLKVYGVSKTNLKLIKIPLPPTKAEQTAIATALNDADALITQLEKLIAKKRAIKQGAMQELLKPKEGWEVKKLGDIVNFSNGKAHEQFIDDNGNFIVVNSKFIATEGKVTKCSNQNICPLLKDEITIVMSDIPNGKALAKCYLIGADNKYTLNQRIGSIKPKNGNSKYFFYQLNRNKYFLSFDSGAGQTNLRKNDILDCPFPLPATIEEQTRIARILSDMDAEIEALENKLNKYKMIKQGMMQNLLTGRIRLV